MEIIVVIAIISVIAAIAMPKFADLIERFRAEEGKETLHAIYASQKRFYIENNNYATYYSDLDIELRPSQYFDIGTTVSAGVLGLLTRKGALYSLFIYENASIGCASGSFPCSRIGL